MKIRTNWYPNGKLRRHHMDSSLWTFAEPHGNQRDVFIIRKKQ